MPLIDWIEASYLMKGADHGVEVRYGPSRAEEVVLAFITGFDWLHHPGSPSTVMILAAPPSIIPESVWPAVRGRVRALVEAIIDAAAELDPLLVREDGELRSYVNG